MNEIAIDFLARSFAPSDTIALVLRRRNPASTQQRIVVPERAIAPRFLAWLRRENSSGADIYVTANPLRPGSRRRTKENVASIRHLYLDIDVDGDVRLAALRASKAVPKPTAILSTSPGKYQVLWRVDGFDFEQQELSLKLLAIAFGGDAACTDCNRVLRVPGFLNCKYEPAYSVTIEYPSNSISGPEDFGLDLNKAFPAAVAGRRRYGPPTNSEIDWAWVCGQLSQGEDALMLTRELAARRLDKPNPLYYAQRTVDMASARLWLIHGISIGDVIAMLESRRRTEIPTTLSAARAREIAATAQRMLARKKNA